MKKYTFLLSLSLLIVEFVEAGNRPVNTSAKAKTSYSLQLNDNDFVKNNVIVRLKEDYRNLAQANAINHPELNTYLSSIGLSSIQKKFPLKTKPAHATNEQGDKLVDLSLIYELHFVISIKSQLKLFHF